MLKYMSLIALSILFSSTLIYMPNAYADYELPESVFGYRMILTSTVRTENNETYIGFVQYKNMTPPFILIETKSYNYHQSRIESSVIDGKLVGRIFLAPGMTAEDIKQLRINGYSVLWKSAE